MISVIVIAALIFLNAFFVTAEFSMIGSSRATIRRLASEGNPGATRVLRLLDDPIHQDRFIATAQLGITVASLALGMVGEHAFAGWLAPLIGDWGIDRFVAAHTAATIASVAVLSYFHIVLGEMVPKSLALQQPQAMAMRIAPLMRLVQGAMYPLIVALNAMGNGVLRLIGIERSVAATHERFRTPDELAYEVRESQRSGLLPDESADVMQELLGFTDLLARSVMVPRVYVTGIPVGANAQRVREILRTARHTRYPIFEGSLDCVLGVMHVKDILRAIAVGGTITADMIRPATFVVESESVEDVLGAMRCAHTQMTIVMDEHGGTAGILTVEDLFEEVVGEIGEASDAAPDVTRDGRGTLRVRGVARIEQVGEALKMPLSHPRVDTVSGLILTLLGRPASVGDCVEHAGVRFEVSRVMGRGVAEAIAGCAPAPGRDSTAGESGPGRAARPLDGDRDARTLETLHHGVELEATIPALDPSEAESSSESSRSRSSEGPLAAR